MSKTQTDKSRLPSKYCQGFVTRSQFLCEVLCELIAKQEGKRLPLKFWELEPWRKIFRRHVVQANKLLRSYPFEVILESLRNSYIQRSKCQSFHFPPFLKLLQKNNSLRKSLTQKYTVAEPPQMEPPIEISIDGASRQEENKLLNL